MKAKLFKKEGGGNENKISLFFLKKKKPSRPFFYSM
jgi:hypothetical protein